MRDGPSEMKDWPVRDECVGGGEALDGGSCERCADKLCLCAFRGRAACGDRRATCGRGSRAGGTWIGREEVAKGEAGDARRRCCVGWRSPSDCPLTYSRGGRRASSAQGREGPARGDRAARTCDDAGRYVDVPDSPASMGTKTCSECQERLPMHAPDIQRRRLVVDVGPCGRARVMARPAHLPLWAAPGARSVGLRNKRRRQNAEADGQHSAVQLRCVWAAQEAQSAAYLVEREEASGGRNRQGGMGGHGPYGSVSPKRAATTRFSSPP